MKSVKNIILDALKFFRIQLLKDNYSTTITNGNRYALSQAGAKAMYDELNSSKAGLTNSNNGVYSSHQIFANDTKCAIQAVNGTTASRLQVGDDGYVAVYKTTDNGATWDNIKSLTATVPYGHKGSNGNFNNLTDTGIWRVDGGWTNGPAHSAYDQVLVVHGSADTVGQMVFRHDASEIYFRTGAPLATSSPAWRAWRNIVCKDTIVGERRSASFSSIAAGASVEITMDLSKSGYYGYPGLAFTCSKVMVTNIYSQTVANGAKVQLINLDTVAKSGTVYVNMIYIKLDP